MNGGGGVRDVEMAPSHILFFKAKTPKKGSLEAARERNGINISAEEGKKEEGGGGGVQMVLKGWFLLFSFLIGTSHKNENFEAARKRNGIIKSITPAEATQKKAAGCNTSAAPSNHSCCMCHIVTSCIHVIRTCTQKQLTRCLF